METTSESLNIALIAWQAFLILIIISVAYLVYRLAKHLLTTKNRA